MKAGKFASKPIGVQDAETIGRLPLTAAADCSPANLDCPEGDKFR
jgi:hypothetical protein